MIKLDSIIDLHKVLLLVMQEVDCRKHFSLKRLIIEIFLLFSLSAIAQMKKPTIMILPSDILLKFMKIQDRRKSIPTIAGHS